VYYVCTVCGARYRPGSECGNCTRAIAILQTAGEDAAFFVGWVRDVARLAVEEHVDREHRDHSDY